MLRSTQSTVSDAINRYHSLLCRKVGAGVTVVMNSYHVVYRRVKILVDSAASSVYRSLSAVCLGVNSAQKTIRSSIHRVYTSASNKVRGVSGGPVSKVVESWEWCVRRLRNVVNKWRQSDGGSVVIIAGQHSVQYTQQNDRQIIENTNNTRTQDKNTNMTADELSSASDNNSVQTYQTDHLAVSNQSSITRFIASSLGNKTKYLTSKSNV